jgi:tRNA-dihydrouridine synthase 3
MGSQDVPAHSVNVNEISETSSRSDEPAAKRVKLDPEVVATGEAVTKEPRVKVNGYALIKEQYVKGVVLSRAHQR